MTCFHWESVSKAWGEKCFHPTHLKWGSACKLLYFCQGGVGKAWTYTPTWLWWYTSMGDDVLQKCKQDSETHNTKYKMSCTSSVILRTRKIATWMEKGNQQMPIVRWIRHWNNRTSILKQPSWKYFHNQTGILFKANKMENLSKEIEF